MTEQADRDPITVDEERCVGSGDCVRIAPRAFHIGDEGHAVVLPTWAEEDSSALEAAIYECPTGAITRRATPSS